MLWSAFVESVKSRLTVDADRLGTEDALLAKIKDGVRDLQTYVDAYREGHETTYLASGDTPTLTNPAGRYASQGTLPAGAQPREAYTLCSEDSCDQTPVTQYSWENRNDLLCGAVSGCGPYIAIDPYGINFWVYPQLVDCDRLLIVWDGLKESFADGDSVPFDEQAAEAVAAYVKSFIAKEVDKDLVLSQSYWDDYAGRPGKVGYRTKCYINARARSRLAPVEAPKSQLNCSTISACECPPDEPPPDPPDPPVSVPAPGAAPFYTLTEDESIANGYPTAVCSWSYPYANPDAFEIERSWKTWVTDQNYSVTTWEVAGSVRSFERNVWLNDLNVYQNPAGVIGRYRLRARIGTTYSEWSPYEDIYTPHQDQIIPYWYSPTDLTAGRVTIAAPAGYNHAEQQPIGLFFVRWPGPAYDVPEVFACNMTLDGDDPLEDYMLSGYAHSGPPNDYRFHIYMFNRFGLSNVQTYGIMGYMV